MNKLKEDKNSLKPMITLFKAHKSLLEFIKEDIKKYNFDINEFSVFEIIYHKKKLMVNDIKDNVLIANSSLTYILDKLVRKNLIIKEKSKEDKRVTYIKLTSEGLDLASEIFPNHYNKLKELFNIYSDEEKEMLVNLTKKIGIHTERKLK